MGVECGTEAGRRQTHVSSVFFPPPGTGNRKRNAPPRNESMYEFGDDDSDEVRSPQRTRSSRSPQSGARTTRGVRVWLAFLTLLVLGAITLAGVALYLSLTRSSVSTTTTGGGGGGTGSITTFTGPLDMSENAITHVSTLDAGTLTAAKVQVSAVQGVTEISGVSPAGLLLDGGGSTGQVFIGSQNVGINTSSPLFTLDVDGELRCTGTFFQDGGVVDHVQTVTDQSYTALSTDSAIQFNNSSTPIPNLVVTLPTGPTTGTRYTIHDYNGIAGSGGIYAVSGSPINGLTTQPTLTATSTSSLTNASYYGPALSSKYLAVGQANTSPNSITIYSTPNSGLSTPTTITVATTAPAGLAFTYDSSYLWVCNNSANTVSQISTATWAVVTSPSAGTAPLWMAASPTSPSLAFSCNGSSQVGLIYNGNNSGSGVDRFVSTYASPYGCAWSFDGAYVYVACNPSTSAGFVLISYPTSSSTTTTSVSTAFPLQWIATHPSNHLLACAASGTAASVNDVIMISGTTVEATIDLSSLGPPGGTPQYSPNGNFVAVPCDPSAGGGVALISTVSNSWIATVTVKETPTSCVWDLTGNYLYVNNLTGNSVSVIENASSSSASVLTTVSMASGGRWIVLSSNGSYLYANNYSSAQITSLPCLTSSAAVLSNLGSATARFDGLEWILTSDLLGVVSVPSRVESISAVSTAAPSANYLKSGNLILQWGNVYLPSSGTATITFPTPWQNYQTVAMTVSSQNASTAYTYMSLGIVVNSNTQATAWSMNAASCNIFWIGIGS